MAEQRTLNPQVQGSTPWGRTTNVGRLTVVCEFLAALDPHGGEARFRTDGAGRLLRVLPRALADYGQRIAIIEKE
jgi:hypothetical protein